MDSSTIMNPNKKNGWSKKYIMKDTNNNNYYIYNIYYYKAYNIYK